MPKGGRVIYSPYVTLDVCTTKSFWVVTIVDRAQSQLTMGKKLKKPKKVVIELTLKLENDYARAPKPRE